MLISPPFIPAPIEGETEDAFLNRAMVGGIPGDGGYPLSFDLNWHGGVHLTAPREQGARLPVRAIAPGKLAYFRHPVAESQAADHPLRYGGKWTDNGCVVICHETEIGEGEQAKVVFYSIYMHLRAISIVNPAKDMKLHRKDIIGEAGCIYGQPHRIHFEIVADQSQIARLVGRTEREVKHQTGSGRTDSCWGDMYFWIPPEALIYENPPADRTQAQNDSPVVYRCPAMPAGPAPVQHGPTLTHTPPARVDGYEWAMASELQKGFFVQMAYAKGQCTLTSYSHSGFELGVQQEDLDYEYNLYTTATKTYPRSPSAGYDLLRFGRVLGPDQLLPQYAAHWRKIKFPRRAGEPARSGWVNLNFTTVTKFSDADFPHWKGWHLIDDDTNADSHCQSAYIRMLLNLDANHVVSDNQDAVSIALSPAYAGFSKDQVKQLSERYEIEQKLNEKKLKDPHTQERIKRLICKFPSEWTVKDFDVRYGWLQKVCKGGPMPVDQFNRLKAHQQALGFWEEAALEDISSVHWHFSPKQFVRMFRKCSWLSLREMAFTLPKYPYYKRVDRQWVAEVNEAIRGIKVIHSKAVERFENYYVDLNNTMVRYCIVGAHRRSHFLAQTILETDRWRTVKEYKEGEVNPRIPATQYYLAFYGRGIMQLTWPGAYEIYGGYRASSLSNHRGQYADLRITATSLHYWADPRRRDAQGNTTIRGDQKRWAPRYDPDLIAENSYNACDSGGFFWVWKRFVQTSNLNRKCDEAFVPSVAGRISILVNGGANGYQDRQAYAQYVYRYLSDSTEVSRSKVVETPIDTVVVDFSMNDE